MRIELGERELQEALRVNLRVLEGRLRAVQQQQEDLRTRQRAFPRLQGQLQTLELNQETDQVTYEYLLSQLYQARIMAAAAEPYVDILDHPVGSTQVPPRGGITVLLGALLGLILGIGSAFFLEYLDRTVRTTADVEAFLGIPVLGIVPRLRVLGDQDDVGSVHPSGGPKVVALDPSDPGAEAYRNLRMNLTFRGKAGEMVQTVLFSSPGPDEGKSTTALNFSVMLAQQGQRVLLLDADLRRPSLHRALDVLRQPGLTDLILGDVDVREAIRPGVMKNLDFLPAGSIPPNPSELLNSRAMKRLLERLEGRYGCVVLDSPPVLAVTDASILGGHSDGIVIVLRSGHTEQRAAERAVEQLKRIGVWVFGAVLNEVATSTAEESYYLQYYYSYRTSSESPGSKIRRTFSKARSWIG